MESMEKLWKFYCAPESQKGLIDRKPASDSAEIALSVKGNFSYGVTPKLDQAEKDKIQEKLKKKEYEKKTEGMGMVRKALFDFMSSSTKKPKITYKDRSLE